ncbi:UNVERIFIED_CONTAM: hypothetical protein FKN15_026720 [Acipenser sinensis]
MEGGTAGEESPAMKGDHMTVEEGVMMIREGAGSSPHSQMLLCTKPFPPTLTG